MKTDYETKIEKILYCPICHVPLARRVNQGFEIIKKHHGENIKVGVEIQYYGQGGQSELICENCSKDGQKAGHIFVRINEGIGLKEEFKAKTEKESQKS